MDQLHSTNAFAIDLIAKNTPTEGTVISTYNQTLGRGQIGRKWDSGKDQNLSFSLILHPEHIPTQYQFQLNMLIALSLRNVLQNHVRQFIQIKWPNDILVNNSKIAGILIQCGITHKVIKYAVCGIGINVLQNDFSEKKYDATSLKLLNPNASYDLEELEKLICEEILRNYSAHKQNQLKEKRLKQEYLEYLYCRGKKVTFQQLSDYQMFEGEIIGVDSIGRLCIHFDNQVKHFQMGELKMIR